MPPNPETSIVQRIRLDAAPDVRLFRNNTGVLPDRQGRPIRFGLAPGSSDLIGWRTLKVGERRLAVFVAIEVKVPGARTQLDHLREQESFVTAVRQAGGLAGFADDAAQAADIVAGGPGATPH